MNEIDGPSNPGKEASSSAAIRLSLTASVAVTFAKTTSSGYPGAVDAARQAQHYAERLLAKKLYHIAAFGTSRPQLALALFVIQQLRLSSTLEVFAGGKLLQDRWRITDVIECCLQASALDDPRAHCIISLDAERLDNRAQWLGPIVIEFGLNAHPAEFDKTRMKLFPCRLLHQRGFKFQINHPSSEAAQIQAAAVREGCDWCPHLLAQGYKKLKDE